LKKSNLIPEIRIINPIDFIREEEENNGNGFWTGATRTILSIFLSADGMNFSRHSKRTISGGT
jgi:hypothetical protein